MSIIAQILPVLLIPLLGYGLARTEILKRQEVDGANKLVFAILIPCLLFFNTAKAELPGFHEMGILVAFYLPLCLVFLTAFVWCTRLKRFSSTKSAVWAVGASYSNATILGLPVAVYAFGEEAIVPWALIIAVHNLTVFTLGVLASTLESASWRTLGKTLGSSAVNLLRVPLTASLLAGLAFNALQIPFPGFVAETFETLSAAAIPCALVTMGATLQRFAAGKEVRRILFLVVLKMAAFPALVALMAFGVLELKPLWASVATLTASMPIGVSAYIFAKQYDESEAAISSGMVLSSLLSLASIPLLIILLPGA